MEVTSVNREAPATAPQATSSRQSVVIVGNGMTSWRLCRELVDTGAIAHLRVTVVGDEPLPAYDRVRLTALLSGTPLDELVLADEEWYAEHGIELVLGEPVTAIDRDECLVRTAGGRELLYDRLVLATGAVPFVPPIPGLEEAGVFVYRSVADVRAIRTHALNARRAVVIGGGLLGIEAAKAARDLGLDVQIIETAPRLMPRQLDERGAGRLLRAIEKLGVRVHVGRTPVSIDPPEDGDDERIVHCSDGGSLRADLVIVAAGVRAASGLASAAGLKLAPSGGVLVDDSLMTTDERVFAVGDCASHEGASYGLVAPGYEMVRVVVSNLIGARAHFRRHAPVARLKLMGVEVSSVGDPMAKDADLRLIFEDATRYRKLLLRRGRLIGALSVGAWPSFERLAAAVRAGQRPTRWELRRFRTDGDLWPPGESTAPAELPPTALVCSCAQVTRAHVDAACVAVGRDVAAVCRTTTASTMCGGCRPIVEALVALAPAPSPAAQRIGNLRKGQRTMPTLPAKLPDATPRPALALRRAGLSAQPVEPSGPAPSLVTFRAPLVGGAQLAAATALAAGSTDNVAVGETGRRKKMAPFRVVPGAFPFPIVATGAIPTPRSSPLLLALTLLALALLVFAAVAPQVAALEPWLDALNLARPRLVRLVTGYTTVGLAALAVLLTLRKRWVRARFGSMPAWRAIHASVATLSILSLAVHTGLDLGENLNRALLGCYLAALVAGGAAGIAYAAQHTPVARRWALRLHVAALLPIPALLACHLIAAYFYG